jgi:hypothetical protein
MLTAFFIIIANLVVDILLFRLILRAAGTG